MAKLAPCLLLTLLVVAQAKVYFYESFDDDWESRWVYSNWKQSDRTAGTFKHSHGKWYGDVDTNMGIQTADPARFYNLSAKFDEFSNEGKDLVIQYSVKYEQKIDCGGAYLKIFPAGLNQTEFSGESVYNIMFGPDICGGNKKVHIIFNHLGNNLDCKKEPRPALDQLTHVYTLIVTPDNTYQALLDNEKLAEGNLEDDWSFLNPKMIPDPDAKKPADWVDQDYISDPEDKKPEGWDDIPEEIADPAAKKPDDWVDEEDGEWIAPRITNPEYKGEWKPKRIKNPDYKGPWVHPQIPNPAYAPDDKLYKYESFGAIGIDVWQVRPGTIFDDILITDSVEEAKEYAQKTWGRTHEAEKAMFEEATGAKTDEKKKKETSSSSSDDTETKTKARRDQEEEVHEDL